MENDFENIDPKDTIVENNDKLMEFKKRLKGQYETVEREKKLQRKIWIR